MGEFRMPSLGADMEAGRVVEWKVHPGDVVHRGDIVAVVDTDKADIEIEIFEDGVIEAIVVPEGEKVPVGTVLARVAEGAAPPATPPPAAPAASAAEAVEVPAPPVEVRPPAPAPARAAGEVSPVVRRLAAHLGVDLATVTGTGPGGRVTRADVAAAAHAAAPPAPVSVTEAVGETTGEAAREAVGEVVTEAATPERAASMRAAIAALMARSKREIPHYYLGTTIDLHGAMAWLEERNATRSVQQRVLPAALLLKAVALALHLVPDLNGAFVDGEFRSADAVHLGVAVSLREGGLVAPALHDADTLPLDDLMARLRDLVTRARALRLRASEMADPTITVTSLGDLGVQTVMPVIYPPQVAIVGFGAIRDRPWATDGLLGVRPLVEATLAADHRVTDGHQGARFLAAVDRLLQTPEDL